LRDDGACGRWVARPRVSGAHADRRRGADDAEDACAWARQAPRHQAETNATGDRHSTRAAAQAGRGPDIVLHATTSALPRRAQQKPRPFERVAVPSRPIGSVRDARGIAEIEQPLRLRAAARAAPGNGKKVNPPIPRVEGHADRATRSGGGRRRAGTTHDGRGRRRRNGHGCVPVDDRHVGL